MSLQNCLNSLPAVLAKVLLSITAAVASVSADLHQDTGNDPLVFISNPVESLFPGHWAPLSIVKAILNPPTKRPIHQELRGPVRTTKSTEEPATKAAEETSTKPTTTKVTTTTETTAKDTTTKEIATEKPFTNEPTTAKHTTITEPATEKITLPTEPITEKPTEPTPATTPTTKEPLTTTEESDPGDGFNGR